MRQGFTLVEMLVVIMIMMMVMAMLLPALAMMQKKADLYSTENVIRLVHNTQRSYAMQVGLASGTIYGYTIRADRKGIQPWDGTPSTSMTSADIGKQMFWNGGSPDYITFTDNFQPVSSTGAPGPPASAPLGDYSIAFVPGAGFACVGTTAALTTPWTGPATFSLRSTRSGYRTASTVEVFQTGMINIYAK